MDRATKPTNSALILYKAHYYFVQYISIQKRSTVSTTWLNLRLFKLWKNELSSSRSTGQRELFINLRTILFIGKKSWKKSDFSLFLYSKNSLNLKWNNLEGHLHDLSLDWNSNDSSDILLSFVKLNKRRVINANFTSRTIAVAVVSYVYKYGRLWLRTIKVVSPSFLPYLPLVLSCLSSWPDNYNVWNIF
jgi:hypothetical protein